MSWQIINVEPAFGVCDQCKKHDCGIVDGQHKWIMTGIYDQSGDAIVIGYKCVELWANNLGISREVVEQKVLLTPTDEQIGDFIRKAVKSQYLIEHEQQIERESHTSIGDPLQFGIVRIPIENMTRSMLKEWLTERKVDFVPQWGEERLREEALKHV